MLNDFWVFLRKLKKVQLQKIIIFDSETIDYFKKKQVDVFYVFSVRE